MKTQIARTLISGAFVSSLLLTTVYASSDNQFNSPAPLFTSQDPLNITLQLDVEKVLNNSEDNDTAYIPAFLIEHSVGSDIYKHDVKVKAAGKTRLNESVCDFPPLRINFKKSAVKNTTFEGQDKIKLITHCRDAEQYENHILLEYLAYRSYQSLTPFSYRVRLVNITYQDITGKMEDMHKTAFFVESDEEMAARIGGVVSDKKIWSADSCRQDVVSLLTMFEFMIGNTDWWIHTRHNVTIVELANSELIPVPYDFDYAGLIDSPYAMPSRLLPISEVRQRFLKSDCKPVSFYESAISTYLDKKGTINSLFSDQSLLDRKYTREAVSYIENFYNIIGTAEAFQKYIDTSCNYYSNPETHLKNRKD